MRLKECVQMTRTQGDKCVPRNVVPTNTANIVSKNIGGHKSRRGQTVRSASWEWTERSVTQTLTGASAAAFAAH